MSEYGRAMPDLYMHACLTCVFVGPCPIRRAIIIYYTLDMLSRIHKHFGSVGVERTCCVADWQKNIGTRRAMLRDIVAPPIATSATMNSFTHESLMFMKV